MEGFIVCSAKEAIKLMEHMDKDDMVILSVINRENFTHHDENIKKEKGEILIRQADSIEYQNNDFFGTLSLFGVLKEKNLTVHNILFPQLE